FMGKGNKNKGKNKAETEPMPWRAVTTKKHDQAVEGLSDTAKANYHTFIGKINNEGKHPKTAAEETGDMHWESLKGGKVPLYEVRLDGKERLTGYEGEKWKHPETGKEYRTFHVHEVGGHTK